MWSSDPGMNQWFSEQQARWTAIHDNHGTPILMAEYADPSSGTAASLESQIEAWGLTPYITSSGWNIQGRGLHIVPPGEAVPSPSAPAASCVPSPPGASRGRGLG